MSAIADHLADRDDLEIGVVLSDRPHVAGLNRAEAAGLPTEVVDWRSFPDRDAFTAAVCDAVEARGCTFIVLAGFMRILAPEAVERFPDRILNIHPSLLPKIAIPLYMVGGESTLPPVIKAHTTPPFSLDKA